MISSGPSSVLLSHYSAQVSLVTACPARSNGVCTAFFHNLGVGPACSILGGISIVMIPIPFVLYVLEFRDLFFVYLTACRQIPLRRANPTIEQVRGLVPHTLPSLANVSAVPFLDPHLH